MNKIKVSAKSLQEAYPIIISCGYCSIENMEYFMNARYYTCGVYGWSSDCYEPKHNVLISTGYRPVRGIQARASICKYYDKECSEIRSNTELTYYQKQERAHKIINTFVDVVIGTEGI